jgi:polyphosphate glucokinase
MQILGIDVGGSGIKGALVDTKNGELVTKRYRIPTPNPSTPKAVAKVFNAIIDHFEWKGPIGVGFPAPILNGYTKMAANVDDEWLNFSAEEYLSKKTGCVVTMINDADAAGLAEMKFGAGKGKKGIIMVITIGTGLGTVLFSNGCLVPNTELGHIEVRGKDAETRASDAARKRKTMSWKKWGQHFNEYLNTLEKLFWPDIFILGGGGSKNLKKFKKYLTVQAKVIPAEFLNEAGIVGAALAVLEKPLE